MQWFKVIDGCNIFYLRVWVFSEGPRSLPSTEWYRWQLSVTSHTGLAKCSWSLRAEMFTYKIRGDQAPKATHGGSMIKTEL